MRPNCNRYPHEDYPESEDERKVNEQMDKEVEGTGKLGLPQCIGGL
jgi:hypothetical protein